MFHKPKINHTTVYCFLISVIWLTPIANFSIDIYSPSLPEISSLPKSSILLSELTITMYIFTYGFGQLVWGWVSDGYGRRKLVLINLLLYFLVTLLISATNNIYTLIIFRFLQGLFAAGISVISKAILVDKFVGDDLAKASTYKVSTQMLSLIAGPSIGSVIQYYLGWKWCFLFLAFYALISLFLVYFYIPETLHKKTPLSNILLNIHKVLSNKVYLSALISTALLYSVVSLFAMSCPFVIFNAYGGNQFSYGIVAFIGGIFYFIGALLNRFKVFSINVCKYSLALLFSMVLLFIIDMHYTYVLLLFLFCSLFVCGNLLPYHMSTALKCFPEYSGISSAIYGSLVMLGVALICFLFSYVNQFISNVILLPTFYCLILFVATILSMKMICKDFLYINV